MAGIETKKVSPYRTICEVHRELYDELLAYEDNEKAIELLKEAYECGKKIFHRLVEYKTGEPYKKKHGKRYIARHLPENPDHNVKVTHRRIIRELAGRE